MRALYHRRGASLGCPSTSIIIDQPTRNAPRMPHPPRPPVMLWVALMFSVGAWAGIVIVALKLLG